MIKNIRIVHFEELTKESIYRAYKNLLSLKTYSIITEKQMVRDISFLTNIKKICQKESKEFLSTTHSDDFDYCVLVNIHSRKEDASDNDDFPYIEIQYLLSFLFQLEKPYLVFFYSTRQDDNQSDYFRLSVFLNLLVASNGLIDSFWYLDIEKEILKDNNRLFNPKRLAYKFNHDSPSSTILPLVSLTKKEYQCLAKPYHLTRAKKSLNQILDNIRNRNNLEQSLYNYYEEFIYQAIQKNVSSKHTCEKWEENEHAFLSTSPPLLVAYLYATVKRHLKDEDLSMMNIRSIIELCYDYYNGFMQLIENSIKHVVSKNIESCAFFTARMHHTKGAMNCYLCNGDFRNIQYFLEVSILDCENNASQTGILAKYNQLLISKNVGSISSLGEIFEHPVSFSRALERYYKNVENVANHYGLQIFDTILTTNKGLFIVQSGETGRANIYSNAHKILYSNRQVYSIKDESSLIKNHFSGTTYTIILPIVEKKESKALNLSLGNAPLNVIKTMYPTNAYSLDPIPLFSDEKEKFVDQYIKQILGIVNNDRNAICALKIEEISTQRIHLELVCKAIISILANQKENKKSVFCLVNIKNEYRLIEAIRIIALFYDKTGSCNFMHNKAIYLACSNNKYDILFSGNSIKAVLENIERQRLIQDLPDFFYEHIMYALKGRINEGALEDNGT